MKINYVVITIVIVVIIAFFYFVIRRNRKDQKDLETDLNSKEVSAKKHDGDKV